MTHDAFEHIARELRPKLLHIGVRFFGNNATAEDIAQETLMRLWLIRERIDLQVGIEPLALRMAKNLCVSEWRKRQVRQSVPLVQEVATSEAATQNIETEDEVERLRRAITLLTPAEQRLFRMRHELEMELSEITAVTGIGPRSVSAMLSTAKRKLYAILFQKGGIR